MLTKIEVVEEEVQSNEPIAEEETVICDCPDCPDCHEEYPCQNSGCKCPMCCSNDGEWASTE